MARLEQFESDIHEIEGNTNRQFEDLRSSIQGKNIQSDRNEREIQDLKPLVSDLRKKIDGIDDNKESIESRKEEYEGLVGVIRPERRDTIIVDDGIASGYTMLAAIHSIKPMSPRTLIVAAPTASARAASLVKEEVDELVCPNIESGFVFAVANAYENWYDVPDTEAKELLKEFR